MLWEISYLPAKNPSKQSAKTRVTPVYLRRAPVYLIGSHLHLQYLSSNATVLRAYNKMQILSKYCTYNDVKVTGKEFLKNLELKKDHRDFHMDMSVLLPSKLHWDFDEAYQFVVDNVISRLP